MPTASPKRRARRPPCDKPGWLWRLLSWCALAFAALVIATAACNQRWDLTWRISPNFFAGTRSGALKIMKDWHGDPSQQTFFAWKAIHRIHDMDWEGRWLYQPALGWYEVPLWLAALIALTPPLILWHLGLSLRARRRARRIAAWSALLLSLLVFAALSLSVLWRGSLTQGGAILTLSRASLSLQLQHAGDAIDVSGAVTSEWVRAAAARPIFLPSWIDSGTHHKLDLPLWIPGLALLAGAAALRRLGRFDPRMLAGHCSGCGYERKGLSQQAPCPECGAP